MRVARLYLKLLLGMGIPFGLMTGLTTGRPNVGIATGLTFGLTMSAIVGTLTVRGHRHLGGDLSPRAASVVRVSAAPAVVRRRVLDALPVLSARIVTDEADRIVACTGMTWRSWGERITVDLDAAAGFTDVTLGSSPTLRWTLVDYGKGRRNVEYLVRALNYDGDGERAGHRDRPHSGAGRGPAAGPGRSSRL